MRTTRFNNRCQHLVVLCPYDLSPSVHTDRGLLPSHFDNNASLIESDGESVLPPLVRNTPCSFEPVAQCLLQTVSVCVPYLDAAVFGAGNNNGQFWVEARKGDVGSMAFESCDKGLGGVVPDLDCAVIGGGENVGFVSGGVVVDVIDTYGVRSEEVGSIWISRRGTYPSSHVPPM